MYSYSAKKTGIRLILLFVGIFLMIAGCAARSPQQPQQQKPKAENKAVNLINGVSAVSGENSGKVEIQATGKLNYTSVKQSEPLGVIFYFPRTQMGAVETLHTPDRGVIKSVEFSSSEDKRNVRMQIGLAKDLPYEVDQGESLFTVNFSGRDETAGAVGAAEIEKPASATRQIRTDKSQDPEPLQQQTNTAKKKVGEYKGLAVIEDIGFETKDSGKSTITIGTSRPAEYDIKRTEDKRLKISLPDAALPEHMDRRPLITTRFDSAIDRIIPYEAATAKDAVEMVIELRESVPYWVERDNSKLMVHFEASTVGPRPYTAAELPDWQQVLEEEITRPAAEGPVPGKPAGTSKTSAKAEEQAREMDWLFEKEEYTGEKIALDFYQTDIRNVFRILQQISGKNYAIDPDVEGQVTISMEKPIPWDQVLNLILKQNDLGMVEQEDIIRIATRETLRKEEQEKQQRIEAYRKRVEQQKALEPLITEYIPINYANAGDEVLPHVKDILSDRGKVSVDSRNNQLIITDTQAKIEKTREVIDQIDQVTPQVVIEARIVEVNEDYLKDIGTEFSLERNDISSSTLSGQYSQSLSMNNPASSSSSIGFSFTNIGTPLTLDAKLTALEEQDNVKIVSSPKIVTLDNKKAKITQGFEYPYQTVEDDDVQIEFKNIDLTLEVTPHVTPDKRISLKIYVTKNDIAERTQEAPALSTNEAETQLLVNDGSTIVIGGIKKDTITERVSGFPVLKDVPMLGWMFKRKFSQREKSELLIFMTPRIVQLEQRRFTAASQN